MHEDCVAALRRDAPTARANRTGAGPVDRGTIRRHPIAQRVEPRFGLRRDRTVGTWPDVEQKIGPLPRGLHQIVDQIAHRLVVVIGEIKSPRIVHRQRRFERQSPDRLGIEAGGVGARQILLERLHILARKWRAMVIRDDQCRWL